MTHVPRPDIVNNDGMIPTLLIVDIDESTEITFEVNIISKLYHSIKTKNTLYNDHYNIILSTLLAA